MRTLQLRIKDRDDEQLEEAVKAAIELGRRYQARLFINDYWRLAIKHQAYGVHLGQEDLAATDLAAIRAAGLRLGFLLMTIWRSRSHSRRVPHILRWGRSFPPRASRCLRRRKGSHSWRVTFNVWAITRLSPSGDHSGAGACGIGDRCRQRGGDQRHYPGSGLARGHGTLVGAGRCRGRVSRLGRYDVG
ncbi:Thiamine-phosphate synthase [Edwardsiella tarda]|nr:Thiamine-phosphate synthase [Edwardsiella tarda]